MIIPLMIYCISLTENKWIKRGIMVAIALCALSALGSYSRGAAIALGAMCFFLWLKLPNKAPTGVAILVLAPLLLMAMPQKWYDRVDTVKTYEQDGSAMGRINAWHMCYNLAVDRPLGGSFDIYTPDVFAAYAPNPLDIHAAHSIYFQVLGEHGFVGLGLYLLLGVAIWRAGSKTIKLATPYPDLRWAANLSRMIQVSILGFAVGGAFLSLLYFDVPYYLMCAIVATQVMVMREVKARSAAAAPARRAQLTTAVP
jgi:probable O-glycosylation ligase (exosortase A-associated)